MKTNRIPLVLALALATAGLAACDRDAPEAERPAATAADAAPASAPAAPAPDAHADAAAAGTDFPVPANHVRWEPDAPLAEGMSRVRTALAGLEAESHPDDATVRARADDIDAAIAYMFANCKLPTEPDVALHAILARLMADTAALKANPSDGSPVADIHDALHNYAQLFVDPEAAART